jgi:uracil-DNA glycosylase
VASRERWWHTPAASDALVPSGKRGQVATLTVVSRAAAACTACELARKGTRTVFGEGRVDTPLMLVGEQPGDKEDRAGRPFVGPAGGLLERALEDAGIDRASIYVTNAVKHFNFVMSTGQRRLHEKPKNRHVLACRGWLRAELSRVAPRVVVCLGATATLALMGPRFRLTAARGRDVEGPAGVRVVATVHPAALLRTRDARDREIMWRGLVRDLKRAHALAARS